MSCTEYMYSVHDVFRGLGLSIHYRQTGRATRNLNPAARSPSSIRRLRDCRAVQVLVGWAVTPRMCTARACPGSLGHETSLQPVRPGRVSERPEVAAAR